MTLHSHGGCLPPCDHIICSFSGQIFYRRHLYHGREDEGVKMRYSLYLQDIYHLLQGHMKQSQCAKSCGRCLSGVLWGLRLGEGLGKWACGRDKGEESVRGRVRGAERERTISFSTRSFHYLLHIQACKSASLKPHSPLGHNSAPFYTRTSQKMVHNCYLQFFSFYSLLNSPLSGFHPWHGPKQP